MHKEGLLHRLGLFEETEDALVWFALGRDWGGFFRHGDTGLGFEQAAIELFASVSLKSLIVG